MLHQVFEDEQEIFSQDNSHKVFQTKPQQKYDLSPRLAGPKQ
jgi:hypothetical protein